MICTFVPILFFLPPKKSGRLNVLVENAPKEHLLNVCCIYGVGDAMAPCERVWSTDQASLVLGNAYIELPHDWIIARERVWKSSKQYTHLGS